MNDLKREISQGVDKIKVRRHYEEQLRLAVPDVGDVVRPADGSALRSGGCAYSVAIVLQIHPTVVLASYSGDMRWEATIQGRKFIVVEKAKLEDYESVKHRLAK